MGSKAYLGKPLSADGSAGPAVALTPSSDARPTTRPAGHQMRLRGAESGCAPRPISFADGLLANAFHRYAHRREILET